MYCGKAIWPHNEEGLENLDLWDVRPKPPPRANDPPTEAFINYDRFSSPGPDEYIIDTDYPIETYLF